jgi:hypothetical protein
MFDLLEGLLGDRNRRRRRDEGLGEGIANTIAGVGRWVIGCGCLLILVVVGITVAVLVSVGEFGNEALVVIVLAAMTVMGIISLARLSLSGRFPGF